MLRKGVGLVALALATMAGCTCNQSLTVGGGGGKDGGTSSTLDGGNVIDVPPFDAGDGVSVFGVPTGGFQQEPGGGISGGVGDGVVVDPAGNLVLSSAEVQLHFAWIANSAAGTVSKYDTKTGKEVGRYHAVIPIDSDKNPVAMRGNQGNSPSRTAVDLFGDVWVANRAPGSVPGSVTKISNSEFGCVDRNGNGKIDTSRDLNGDGMIDTNPANGEFIVPTDWSDPTQYDECILFSTPVGTGSDVKARAIAISVGFEGSAGDVWVGLYGDRSFIKLNAADGKQVPVNASGAMSVPMSWGPYGAAIDSKQRLWTVYPGVARLALIDTKTGTLVTDTLQSSVSTGAYAMGVDGKDRVWLAGWDGAYATRYDHGPGLLATPGSWTKFSFAGITCDKGTPFGIGRGIAADDQGVVFMSAYSAAGILAAQVIAFDAETGQVRPFAPPGGPVSCVDATSGSPSTNHSIGVGIDSDGHPWVNNYSGNAIRVHRTTGEVLRTAQQGAGLYTYSDFTGYQLRKFTAPRGTYRKDFESCGPLAQWQEVSWSAATLPNTAIQLFVKVADELGELNNPALPKYGPFTTSPVDLVAAGVPRGKYFRVEFVLTSSDAQTSPVLKGYSIKSACQADIN
jgi:hypothetical protein